MADSHIRETTCLGSGGPTANGLPKYDWLYVVACWLNCQMQNNGSSWVYLGGLYITNVYHKFSGQIVCRIYVPRGFVLFFEAPK